MTFLWRFCQLIIVAQWYTIICVRQRKTTSSKGSEGVDNMTTAELNQYLETIAKLIEATAATPAEAAEIVRESQVKA